MPFYSSNVHDERNTDTTLLPTENMWSENMTGLPSNILNLKVNATLMLLRNIYIHNVLCNGTRMPKIDIRKSHKTLSA